MRGGRDRPPRPGDGTPPSGPAATMQLAELQQHAVVLGDRLLLGAKLVLQIADGLLVL